MKEVRRQPLTHLEMHPNTLLETNFSPLALLVEMSSVRGLRISVELPTMRKSLYIIAAPCLIHNH
jgi:hypothetical protein